MQQVWDLQVILKTGPSQQHHKLILEKKKKKKWISLMKSVFEILAASVPRGSFPPFMQST